jgi:hypothetical protein
MIPTWYKFRGTCIKRQILCVGTEMTTVQFHLVCNYLGNHMMDWLQGGSFKVENKKYSVCLSTLLVQFQTLESFEGKDF